LHGGEGDSKGIIDHPFNAFHIFRGVILTLTVGLEGTIHFFLRVLHVIDFNM